MFRQTSEFLEWFAEQQRVQRHRVTPVPLEELDGWSFDPETGNLGHRTGKFFTIEGVEVETDRRETPAWSQPVIVQPEAGVLGIVVQEFDGVPHFLLQAKMEPGNINLLQLSPTVQATRSNYTRVHAGRPVPYLEHFLGPSRGRVVFDALQSEQGAWFLAKRNRNMIVEARGHVPVRPGFCWLTLEQIGELLRADNLVNMDTRTVLSGLPWNWRGQAEAPLVGRLDGFADWTGERSLHRMTDLRSALTEVRSTAVFRRRRVPLADVKGWSHSGTSVTHEDGRFFSVMGVDVEAEGREVSRWSQPMLAPAGRGLIAFLARHIEDRLHLLVRLRTEAGTFDVAELGPTVQCLPSNYRHLPIERRPRYLGRVRLAPRSATLLDVVHSEEGGRFHHAENRYVVVADEDAPLDPGEGFVWMTPCQLAAFAQHANQVNVEARNLLTCLRFLR
ncbi:NDP-hexose 2,3-dehydratase family protein [Streptomyces sp. TRM 70351]|uniref:NDP-hexose 2,3-dehydratase family protein n=1 Tax=Streptomyces sp. TRM 70351 TaxID=3116552 RepID=UPI002E7B86EF|nr:NDP-hexose 2,3-dehydratase family protein [Streptomyces sp. TRM 70351]MEE1929385.1 NDP-hexose 2,3-dehydratase family protein [Streptomyces sp. TRM 70351]